MRKRVAHEQALWYEEELNKEIEKDRLAHGKKPLKKKDDNQPPASGGTGNDKDAISEELPEDVKTQKCSISDPESGWFRKGEHKHVFAYAVETACDKHAWILGYTVHLFRIPVPRPKKAFSENTNSHMMNTMIVIYVREHIY